MSSTPGVTISPTGQKIFIPLENNPAVFSDLVHRLGVSSQLTFHDVYSLDLIQSIPRPAHALILIAPAPVYYAVRSKYDGYPSTPPITYNASGPAKPVIWFKQTIGHACGLYSLIHAVGNGSAKAHIHRDSLLDRLLHSAIPLKRKERAEVLYNSQELEEAHMASARMGDSRAPSSQEPVGYHFITFVKGDDGHLWELEGSWDPLDRGELGADEDVLSAKALEVGVGKYMREAEVVGNAELSIVALATGE
ncbi:related to ubiquitin thiolesterase L3 [Ramularia collo-cygni]|uniref:Ubiquitin carboxyl-terminal hydrolase n=1 Tax=Ramularia collo-cygni TaxID=112498 RepID=A0A2D3UQ25_9PEZI|nr:related to ubiquitin thiolesterase L3 [Ramularia collo-cygni]CZT16218.1 related to ubiquitin thiolesterase L3 [Ramularia collo-cygni]